MTFFGGFINRCLKKELCMYLIARTTKDVIIQRVHAWVDQKTIKQRYEHINNFEKLLSETEEPVEILFARVKRGATAKITGAY